MTYTVWSPSQQTVSLGADMAPAGSGQFVGDPANDTQLTVNAGANTVTRLFNLASRAAGSYDVRWGLAGPGFNPSYGLITVPNALSILAATVTSTSTATASNTATNTATATATRTSTATNTPPATATPSQPVLQAVGLRPNPAYGGQTIVMSYTVWSPSQQTVSLGADMAPAGTGAYQNDPANDAQVTVNAGVTTVTRLFNLGTRAPGGYDVRWGLWSSGFGTQYGLTVQPNYLTILAVTATPSNTNTPGPTFTPTNTVSPTPGSPTATPSSPQLQAVALGPTTTNVGDTIVMTYTVWSPNTQLVSLGGDMAPAGSGAYVNDPANDVDVQINPGLNTVTRLFNLDTRGAGSYDVRWGLFQAHFATQYGLQVRSNALTILAATVTPTGTRPPTFTPTVTPTGPTATSTATATGTPPTATRTPLVTNTPTPSAPTLSNATLGASTVPQGGTVVLNFTIFSPAGGTYALGADLGGPNQYTDPGNDRLVTVPAGVSNVSRNFYIRPDDATGLYNVAFGLWNTGFTTQYGSVIRNNALTIGGATPTPSAGIPTYTPTTVPPPSPPGLSLDVTQPLTVTVNAGGTINLSYRIINNTGSAASVKLGASLAPSGQGGYGVLTDAAHESVITAATGTNTYTRVFSLPATSGGGSYDLTWSLINPANSSVISTRTAPNLVWVTASTSYTGSISLFAASLTSNNVTLQSGVVNRIVGNFTVENDLGTTQGVIVRMRIKQSGTTQWINDLGNDTLFNAAPGNTNISRSFIVPRYIAAGTHQYDVLFELGDPDFNGAIDNNEQDSSLTITNPTRISNVGVPILMYHNVNPTAPGGNWVKYDNFVQQMDYLANNGWTTITGEDMYNYIYKGTALPALPIWITFDDSYQNVYDYAYPIMSARHQTASVFTNTQWMGQMNSWDLCCEPQHMHMTWNMLGQMTASGFVADSHTQHHVHLFDLQPNEQQADIWGSQRDLVSFLGTPGKNFSYPYGQYPDSAEWAVAHSGFHSAVIIGQAKQHTDFANMFELTRIGIADSDTLQNFITKITAP